MHRVGARERCALSRGFFGLVRSASSRARRGRCGRLMALLGVPRTTSPFCSAPSPFTPRTMHLFGTSAIPEYATPPACGSSGGMADNALPKSPTSLIPRLVLTSSVNTHRSTLLYDERMSTLRMILKNSQYRFGRSASTGSWQPTMCCKIRASLEEFGFIVKHRELSARVRDDCTIILQHWETDAESSAK